MYFLKKIISFIKGNKFPYFGLCLGIFALLLRYVVPPQYIEAFYSRHVFLWVRGLFDFTLAFVPFPLLLVFYVVAFYFVFKIIFLLFLKKMPLRQRFTEGGKRGVNFLGFMLFGFLFCGDSIMGDLSLQNKSVLKSKISTQVLCIKNFLSPHKKQLLHEIL